MYEITFDNKIDCDNCYDNCIYNHKEARQIPVFKTYNVTTRLDIIYVDTMEYSDILLLGKCQRLLTKNPPKRSKTTVE